MAKNIKMTSVEGVTLFTKNKYVEDDIYVSNGLPKYDGESDVGSKADTLSSALTGTLTSYSSQDITKITPYLFYENTRLKTINTPNVTTVGEYAFYNCSALKNLNLGALTSVGAHAFEYCQKIPDLDLSQVEGTIGDKAFYCCYNLTNLTLLKATDIGDKAFYSCDKIKKIYCPELTNFSTYAFSSLDSLEEVDMPKLTSAGSYGFEYCSKLKKVNFPSLTYLNTYFLAYCDSIEEIYLPKVTYTNERALHQNINLKKVIFDNIRSFGAGALSRCSSLEQIIIRTDYDNISYRNENNDNGSFPTDFKGKFFFLSHLVDTYKSNTDWSRYADQIRPIYSTNIIGSGRINQTINESNETILTAISNGNAEFIGWYTGDIAEEKIIEQAEHTSLDVAYPFEINENGYWQNTNQNQHSTVSIGRFNFNIEETNQKLIITYLQSSEANYDYGVIGNIDTALTQDVNASGYISLKGQTITTPKEIIIENIGIGQHFIDILYRKDNSANNGLDALQVKVGVDTNKTKQIPSGELYSEERQINIGIVDEKTMLPLNLVATFEVVEGGSIYEEPIQNGKELTITQLYNSTKNIDTLEVE